MTNISRSIKINRFIMQALKLLYFSSSNCIGEAIKDRTSQGINMSEVIISFLIKFLILIYNWQKLLFYPTIKPLPTCIGFQILLKRNTKLTEHLEHCIFLLITGENTLAPLLMIIVENFPWNKTYFQELEVVSCCVTHCSSQTTAFFSLAKYCKIVISSFLLTTKHLTWFSIKKKQTVKQTAKVKVPKAGKANNILGHIKATSNLATEASSVVYNGKKKN